MHNVLKHNKIYYDKTFSIITCRQQTPRVIGASWTWDSQRTWQSTAVEERDNDAFQNGRSIFFKAIYSSLHNSCHSLDELICC